jgi:cytochrome P450
MTDEAAQEASNRVPTGVELTALDPAFRTDPHPMLARLREREPVHYDEANEGTYMRIFAGRDRTREPSMLMLDAPAHTRLRSLVNKAFTPRAVELLAPRIRELAGELLAVVAGQESFDVIEAVAGPLPVIVIAEMLGIDPADRDDFRRWSDMTAPRR